MFGKVGPRSLGVSVYTLDNVLVQAFSSRDEAAIWLGVSDTTVTRYIRTGKVLKGVYLLRNTAVS